MPSLNMNGPYSLWIKDEKGNQAKNIGNIVPEDAKCGNYAFGYTIGNTFFVKYVGRSDHNLQSEIEQQMDTDRAKGCDKFMYSQANNAKEAFEKECRNFHDFGGADHLNNQYHPDKPDNTDYKCPVVDCEYHK